jgi:RNA polymerase sigma factor for flagellar operon FliA
MPGDAPDPAGEYEDFTRTEAIVDAIDQLPERERTVLALYYDEELNLREIGEVLGVTESRVCQIHSQALVRLRSRLTEWQSGTD